MDKAELRECFLTENTEKFLVELTKNLHVTIRDGFFLGLSFGMGFGLGMLIWALAFLFAARALLLASL